MYSAGPQPYFVFGHTMVHIGSVIVIHGGKEGGKTASDRMFLLHYQRSPMLWQELTPKGLNPGPRWGHTAIVIDPVPMTPKWSAVHAVRPAGKGVLYFAGMNNLDGPLNDLWFFDPAAESWTKLVVCGCLSCSVYHALSPCVPVPVPLPVPMPLPVHVPVPVPVTVHGPVPVLVPVAVPVLVLLPVRACVYPCLCLCLCLCSRSNKPCGFAPCFIKSLPDSLERSGKFFSRAVLWHWRPFLFCVSRQP